MHMGWRAKPDQARLEVVMRTTKAVRQEFHALRMQPGTVMQAELAVVDRAEAELAAHGFNKDEQLAARIRFAQFRAGILAVYEKDTNAAVEACLAMINGDTAGPVSRFMQARIGMVVLSDLAVNNGEDFPRERFKLFFDVVTGLLDLADDEFWFFATLQAYKQGWTEVLVQAIEQVGRRWEEASGLYLAKRTALMLNLLRGTASELDCGAALQAVNQPLFINEFTEHLLADCERAGIMSQVNRQIWTERKAEHGVPELYPAPSAR